MAAMTSLDKADDTMAKVTELETVSSAAGATGAAAPNHDAAAPPAESEGQLMRTAADELGVWQTLVRFRRVGLIAMAAAFSASLDGYQFELSGGIVANKGFIRQFASPGTTIIAGSYVSAWGGMQSAGQCIGQVLIQYASEAWGRKRALLILWAVLIASILVESLSTHWLHWLAAKVLAGAGLGMLQCTLPLYLTELAPTAVRGFYINAYTLWFIAGKLFASIALNSLDRLAPLDFRTPVYTQWGMVAAAGLIFVLLPETPWWLVSKDKFAQAERVLRRCHGQVPGFDVMEQLGAMRATVALERRLAETSHQAGAWEVFRGRNLLRFVVAGWPKLTQQFVGLAIFNTYAAYFFQAAGNDEPFFVIVLLAAMQLLSMAITCPLADRVGRRPLTVYPYAVTVLAVLGMGITGCFDLTSRAPAALLIFFACVAGLTTTGASALGYAYAAEIPAQRLRARTSAWSLAVSNLVALVFSFATPVMLQGEQTQWGPKTGFL